MTIKSRTSVIVLSSLAVMLTVVFQNCGDVTVAPQEQAAEIATRVALNSSIKACAQASAVSQASTKNTFIVDMSLSNLTNTGLVMNQSTPINGTDTSAVRLTKIAEFISTCGGANSQYAFIPFTEQIIGGLGCPVQFEDASTASTTIDRLIQIQNTTRGQISPCTVASGCQGIKMQSTSYKVGLDCYRTFMAEQLNNPANTGQSYQTFFITDGKPNLNDCVNLSLSLSGNDPRCFSNLIDVLYPAAIAAGHSFNFYSLFYGPLSAEAAASRPILEALAQTTGNVARELNSVSNINLCEVMQASQRVRQKLTTPIVVNLTAQMRGGILVPDSDSDGIVDSEDEHPTTRTSPQGYLELIQKNAGATATCQPSSRFLGLNDCDRNLLGLQANAFDTDLDGLIDSLEILRGLNPRSQADSVQDIDGDSLPAISEISLGRNPFEDDRTPPENTLTYTFQLLASADRPATCAADQEAREMRIDNLPIVQTLEFADIDKQGDRFDLSHSAGENLILIYFYSKPVDGLGQQTLLGKILKVSNQTTELNLSPTDFEIWGESR